MSVDPALLARLRDYVRQELPSYIELLEGLVAVESPSNDPDGVTRVADAVAAIVGGDGATVRRHRGGEGAGDNLIAEWAAEAPTAENRHVMVLAHNDTVWPHGETKKRPFAVKDGLITGPGTYDMKAGLANAIFAVRALRAIGVPLRRPVKLVCAADEEIGSPTARALIEREAEGCVAALVVEGAEPRTGALRTARKGIGVFNLKVEGRASHAGSAPRDGINANEELAQQIVRIHALTDHERGTTLSCGVVRGGIGITIISPSAEAEIDVRIVTQDEGTRIEALLRGLAPVVPGAKIAVDGVFTRPPMLRTAGNAALFGVARAVGSGLGLDLAESASGGGSDGNFTSALGVPTLDGIGAVGWGAHAVNESVVVDALPDRIALLAGMLIADLGDLQ